MTLFTGGDNTLFTCDFDKGFRKTHLGQAHIAGTGPAGKTCRNCKFFGLRGKLGTENPGYYSRSDKMRAFTLKPGKCLAPMPHKANKKFPHTALSCRLFEQTDNPFPVSIKD